MQNIMFLRSKVPGGRPKIQDFTRPFKMLRFVAILIPATLYMACFGYGTVLFALTGASLFTKLYGFTTAETGLILSIPLLIGGGIGELSAGWVTDWLSNRHAQRHNGERLPESRLTAIWGALLIPIGLIIEGVCLSHADTVSWVGSAFGMGIANMGLQIATTTIYAYTTDVSQIFSWGKSFALTRYLTTVLQTPKCRGIHDSEYISADILVSYLFLRVSMPLECYGYTLMNSNLVFHLQSALGSNLLGSLLLWLLWSSLFL